MVALTLTPVPSLLIRWRHIRTAERRRHFDGQRKARDDEGLDRFELALRDSTPAQPLGFVRGEPNEVPLQFDPCLRRRLERAGALPRDDGFECTAGQTAPGAWPLL